MAVGNGLQFFCCRGNPSSVTRANHDMGTLGGEPCRSCFPKSLACSTHNRNTPAKSKIHWSFLETLTQLLELKELQHPLLQGDPARLKLRTDSFVHLVIADQESRAGGLHCHIKRIAAVLQP